MLDPFAPHGLPQVSPAIYNACRQSSFVALITSMADGLLNEFKRFLDTPEPPGLGCGARERVTPASVLEAKLTELSRSNVLPELQASLLKALCLLWHDHLDAAHRLVQEVDEPDGSLLHAIMHRREGDYWNSKYWFRRAGAHPVLVSLSSRAAKLLAERDRPDLVKCLLPTGKWDSAAFVDQCQQAVSLEISAPHYQLLCALQGVEFELMLKHLCLDWSPPPPEEPEVENE